MTIKTFNVQLEVASSLRYEFGDLRALPADLYRWFPTEAYRDDFLKGNLFFSSRMQLHLNHDTAEYNVKGSIAGNCYSISLTANTNGAFWQKNNNDEKLYGVRINTELFFNKLERFFKNKWLVSCELISLTCDQIKKGLHGDSFKDIKECESLIDKAGLTNREGEALMNYIAYRQKCPNKLSDEILFDIFESSTDTTQVIGLFGYPIEYYDPTRIRNSFEALPHNMHKAKGPPGNFELENEYRVGLAGDFSKYAKRLMLNGTPFPVNPTHFIQFLKIECPDLTSALTEVN